MYLRRVARTIPGGASVPNGTSVALHLHVDDSPIATTTVSGGHYVFQLNGNPGPHYTKLVHEGQTQIISSKAQGVSGTIDIGNIPLVTRAFSDGYIPGALNQLAPSATGTSMNVTVATGAALVRGILYDQFQALPIAIGAASTSPRIDRIVVEVVPTGGGENIEGRSRVVVKPGTPAATPVAPALVQTATLWEWSIATVLVDPSVTAIAANKVTDTRTISQPIIQPGSIAAANLAPNVTEYVQDTTAGFIVGGTNVTATYDDAANTLTISSPTNTEAVQDIVAGLIAVGGGLAKAYDDALNVLSLTIADGGVTDAKLATAYLPLTGGTITGKLHYTATNFAIEIGALGVSNTPALEFHSGVTATDRDARISVTGGNGADFGGTLHLQAASIQVNGTEVSVRTPTLMPGSEYVATGALTTGSRILKDLTVGPLVAGITYDLYVQNFCTLRGTGSGGTVSLETGFVGGTMRTHEFQVVGTDPRGAQVSQSVAVTGAGGTVTARAAATYVSGAGADVRAGELSVIAIPR